MSNFISGATLIDIILSNNVIVLLPILDPNAALKPLFNTALADRNSSSRATLQHPKLSGER